MVSTHPEVHIGLPLSVFKELLDKSHEFPCNTTGNHCLRVVPRYRTIAMAVIINIQVSRFPILKFALVIIL